MKKYAIQYKYNKGFNAGSKARDDVNSILNKQNVKIIDLEWNDNIFKKIINFYSIDKYIGNIDSDSIVILQWPIAPKRSTGIILKKIKKKRCKVILIIHDIISLRFNDIKYINKEIGFFNSCDVVIYHNNKMFEWMISNGFEAKGVNLQIFDYLSHGDDQFNESIIENNDKISIAFAGNLSRDKSGFIYDLSNEILGNMHLNLYGDNIEEKIIDSNISYKGKFKPEDLIYEMKDDFGLVWDGNSVISCEGIFGEYMKYNNPHKVSLYISAGLPIIIWEKAALASFVRENNIGIVIKQLSDIKSLVVDDKLIREYKRNVIKLSNNLKKGYYINKALNEAYEIIMKI